MLLEILNVALLPVVVMLSAIAVAKRIKQHTVQIKKGPVYDLTGSKED